MCVKEKAEREAREKHEAQEAAAQAKLSKNRAKRQRKKQRSAKGAPDKAEDMDVEASASEDEGGERKRKLANPTGQGFKFLAPGQVAAEDEDSVPVASLGASQKAGRGVEADEVEAAPAAVENGIRIVDED